MEIEPYLEEYFFDRQSLRYAKLKTERSDAYPYYNALLASLVSFCNALEQVSKQT